MLAESCKSVCERVCGWECGRASESESGKVESESEESGGRCVVEGGTELQVVQFGAAPALGHTGTAGWEEGEN